MSEKKVGKRLLTWVLVLVMTLSLLPLNVLAANPAVMRIVRPDTDKYITYNFYLTDEEEAEPYDSQIIKSGNSLTAPATPEKEGYQFTGWFDQDENEFIDFETPISVTEDSTDVDLYAKFVPVCYVYFMDGEGEGARIIATETLTPEGSLSSEDFKRAALLVPVSAEQAVIGWTKDNEQVDNVSYVEGGSIYLYPIVANGHWITFDSKGGSYVEPQFVTDTTKKPTPPAKPGYDFAGWYTNEETNNEFEFGNILSNNLTLYAKWTPNNRVSYTVIHWWENANDDGYSFHESKTEYGKVGATTSVSAERYNGFTAQTINQETIAGDGSTIVNVYYKRNVYTVKFYSYSSWVSRSEEYTNLRITAKYGANISDKWPTYDGSSTWSTNDSKNEGPYQVNLQTMPLNGDKFYGPKTERGSETAYYYVEVLPGEASDKTYNRVGYKLHHKDTSPGEGYTITEEDKYPITGFNFKTFEADRTWSGKYAYDNAKFYYTRNSYDIVYVNTGAKGNDNKHTVSYKFEASIADAGNYKPTTVPEGKEGYVFAGWYADPTGETPYDFNKTMPAQNITVYAKWKAPTFTVTVHDSDKKVLTTISNVPLRGTISKDAMPTDDVTLAEGDTFLGWTYEDGTPFNFNTAITQDIELYARVGNKTGYSVTYNYKNGSNLVTDPSKYAKGAFATVFDGPDTAPANQVFLGWTTKNDGSKKVEYYPNSSIEITGNVTLYAVYGDTAETVTVTYHSNFGSTDSKRTTNAMPNNGKFSVADYSALDLPDRTGYEFIGWSTKSGEQEVEFEKDDDARADKNGSNDLYAQWKSIQITDKITVTIKGNTSTVTYDGTEKSVTGYTVERSDNRYTENDFTFSGTALAKGTDAGTYNMGLNAGQFTNTNTNFTNVTFVISTDGELKIEPRKVTLTSGSGSKVYDGKPLTKPEVTCEDAVFKSEVTEIKATGSVSDVEKSPATNTITYTPGANFKEDNYNIEYKPGTLTITPVKDKVTINITGHTKTEKYSGSVQSVTGYDVTNISNKLYTENDFTFTGEAKANGTDAGSYPMGLPKANFTNNSKNFTNVEFVVEDGSLTITKRDVTLTSASASKLYDGTPLTKDTVTVGGDDFVEGQGATYTVTGSQTDVGKSDNEFTYELNANTKANNYNITMYKGELVITAADSVAYKVEHYKQNLDGSYNDTPNDIDPLSGTAGTLTAAAAKDYPGFTPGTVTQEKIKSDGTTTVEIQYTRNSYTLTINYVYRDGSKAAESHIETILYGKDYSVTSPKISGYTADKLVVSGTMPADNRTVTVTYTKNGGHHPRPKPTVEIEDDDALGLNTTDHFAYIVGYGNGEVRPQNNITRAEVATIFFRLLTDDVRDENLTKTNRYSDVAATSWYNTAVSTLSSMGIITGYPDGTFRPNAAITRAEFAAIAARFDNDGDKTAAKFSDIATHWAKDEISIAYNNGWITGYPDGTFGPQRDITRAETMTLVNRVLNRQPETEDDLLPNMMVWTDNANPNAWYYLAVQEATNSHYYEFKTNSQYEKWTELRETRDWTQLEK